SKLHLRHRCELRNLILPFSSLHAAIDLLQTNQVRLLFVNDVRDALQVQLLIHADSDVDVVSHHTQRFLLRSRRNAATELDERKNYQESKPREMPSHDFLY